MCSLPCLDHQHFFFFSVRSCLEELFSREYYSSKVQWAFLCATTVRCQLGVIGLVTPSSTREEESITSYSCFSLRWGILLATDWHSHQVQGTSILRLIRRKRAIEVKQLAQGCKQTWQRRESNQQPSDHESNTLTKQNKLKEAQHFLRGTFFPFAPIS
jgi:UV DNA damage repair endonuclease